MMTKQSVMAMSFALWMTASVSAGDAQLEQEVAPLRDAGFAALYNLNYSEAESYFQRLVELAPDHPAGYLYQAAVIWIRTTDQHRRLQTALYNDDSFYEKLDADSGEPADPEINEAFQAFIEKAKAAAEKKLRANKADAEALYFLGSAYAIQAGYEATVTRRFFSALRHGGKAAKLHRRVLKLDPSFVDAYLMVGLYNYAVGSVSWGTKILLGLMGFRGNRQRGLQQIERVAREGRQERDDAKVILVALYQREDQPEKALAMIDQLYTAYPQNDLFVLEKANALVSLKREPEALALLESLIDSGEDRRALDLITFRYGEALLASGQYEAAAHAFEQAAAIGDPYWATLAHLRAGQALDLANRRDEAKAQYGVVLQRTEAFNSHKLARQYLKRPYSGH